MYLLLKSNKIFITILPLILCFNCFNWDFSEQADEVKDVYSDIVNDVDNKYYLTDSNITVFDTIPKVVVRVGYYQQFYSYSSSWTGGLQSTYNGRYIIDTVNNIEDSIKIVKRWYSRDRYSKPILMDDSSQTFRCEDILSAMIDGKERYNIILNSKYGLLFQSMSKSGSTMDGQYYKNIYLELNGQDIPVGKLLNEFYLKEDIIKPKLLDMYYINQDHLH